MNLIRRFIARPDASDCGRQLAEFRCLNERARKKARARLMRQEMGLPPLEALN